MVRFTAKKVHVRNPALDKRPCGDGQTLNAGQQDRHGEHDHPSCQAESCDIQAPSETSQCTTTNGVLALSRPYLSAVWARNTLSKEYSLSWLAVVLRISGSFLEVSQAMVEYFRDSLWQTFKCMRCVMHRGSRSALSSSAFAFRLNEARACGRHALACHC